MKISFYGAIALLALNLLASGVVHASQQLYYNAPLITSDLGFFSDARFPEFQADDFYVDGELPYSVTSVKWWGRYFKQGAATAVTPEGSDNFIIRFFEKDGAGPALSPFTSFTAGAVARVDAGTSGNGVPLFSFHYSLPNELLLNGGQTYYISIVNFGGIVDDPVFSILWSTPLDWTGHPRWRRTNEANPWQLSGYNTAFQLNGEVVPEPASLLVLGAGAAVFGQFRKKA